MADQTTAYQRWYAKNRDKINRERREKYQSDPEYRDQAVRASRAARAARPEPSKAGQSRFKDVGGVVVETMSISELARFCGRSIQTIRLWESKGFIPEPTVTAGKRFYTHVQCALVRELALVMDSSLSLNRKARSDVIAGVKAKINALWASL